MRNPKLEIDLDHSKRLLKNNSQNLLQKNKPNLFPKKWNKNQKENLLKHLTLNDTTH